MSHRLWIVLGATCLASLSVAAQTPIPGVIVGAKAGGAGIIVGQVIDGATGRPVPEAIVDLLQGNAQGAARVREMADADGRFVFTSLPPGSYNVASSKPGYLPTRGLQRRLLGVPLPFELADGERRLDLRLTMWKYATVAGTVQDEFGEPMAGILVRALKRAVGGGRTNFSGPSSTVVTTDDRGAYRIPTLVPGDYLLVVQTTLTTFPASAFDGWGTAPTDPRVQAEQSMAISEISPPGMPRTEVVGRFAVLSANRDVIPPAPANGTVARVYPSTFHPSASSFGEATIVSLTAGEERTAINIQLKPLPAVRVSGTLVGPAGPLARTALRLTPVGSGDVFSELLFMNANGVTDGTGAFTLMGVPSGQYVLKVLTPAQFGGPTLPSTAEKPVLWANEPVTVGQADIDKLTVLVRPTLRISGRMEFQGTKPVPPNEIAGAYINLDSATGSWGATTVLDEHAEFETGLPAGNYSVRIEAPSGWQLKSILRNGKDATDGGLALTSDSELNFVLTDSTTRLSGKVQDSTGAPDSEALVAIFPVNTDWRTGASSYGWRVRSAQAGRTGAFSIAGIPAGEYFVAIVPDALADTWQDPAALEQLSRGAARVVIALGDEKAIELRSQVRR